MPGFPTPKPRPSIGAPRGRFQQEFNSKDEHRINERIRVPQVRLIDEQGQQVGVVSTIEALRMARDRGLDLIEIAPNVQPPVCKLLDYGKFKFEKKKKEHAAKKKQVVIKVKEVQLRPNTDSHDLDYKMRNVRNFLTDGDRAKICILYRGREMAHMGAGIQMLQKIADGLADIATVEYAPKAEGRKLIMILAPGKKPAAPAKPSVPVPPKPVAAS
jgi:translation initiation factor IF-3